MSSKQEIPHSGHYFGDQRDYWWNYDFLELMAKRWNLDNVSKVLDVGCGIGHWGFILEPFFSKQAHIYGIDREIQWIEEASSRAKEKNLNNRYHYKIGDIQKIPFEDNHFDMVTCQTVLIHVPDVKAALSEMIRVLKPGGLLAVAEPNNIALYLIFNTNNVNEALEPLLDLIRFQIMCERGKQALGLGYNSIGDLLPDYFSKQSLENIQVFLSDKTSPLIPPYSSKEQKVLLKQAEDWLKQEVATWPKNETLRYFIAGGGEEIEFDIMWPKLLQGIRDMSREIEEGTLSSIGTAIMYLVSGRKRSGSKS